MGVLIVHDVFSHILEVVFLDERATNNLCKKWFYGRSVPFFSEALYSQSVSMTNM